MRQRRGGAVIAPAVICSRRSLIMLEVVSAAPQDHAESVVENHVLRAQRARSGKRFELENPG
jgi:hypothetical protein